MLFWFRYIRLFLINFYNFGNFVSWVWLVLPLLPIYCLLLRTLYYIWTLYNYSIISIMFTSSTNSVPSTLLSPLTILGDRKFRSPVIFIFVYQVWSAFIRTRQKKRVNVEVLYEILCYKTYHFLLSYKFNKSKRKSNNLIQLYLLY